MSQNDDRLTTYYVFATTYSVFDIRDIRSGGCGEWICELKHKQMRII